MKTQLLSILALVSLSQSVLAQELSLSGRLNLALNMIGYSGDKADTDNLSVQLASQESNIRLQHSQKLLPKLTGYATFAMRHSGSQGNFDNQSSYHLGLFHETYGGMRFGKQRSAASKMLEAMDPLYGRLGHYKNFSKSFSELNRRIHDEPYRDTISYLSPTWQNVSFEASIVTDQDSMVSTEVGDSYDGASKTGNTNEPHTLGLSYDDEQTKIGIATTRLLGNAVTKAQTSLRLGASRQINNLLIAGLYDYANDEQQAKHHAVMLSGQLRQDFMRYTAQINYAQGLQEESQRGMSAQLAFDYLLNHNSYFYVQYSIVKMKEGAHTDFGQLSHDGDQAISAGLVYQFESDLLR